MFFSVITGSTCRKPLNDSDASLAFGRAVSVWSLRHLLPGNSQADRVALYAKALYFLFFFLFCVEVLLPFLSLYTLFFRKWQHVGVFLDLRREAIACGHQRMWVLYFNTL